LKFRPINQNIYKPSEDQVTVSHWNHLKPVNPSSQVDRKIPTLKGFGSPIFRKLFFGALLTVAVALLVSSGWRGLPGSALAGLLALLMSYFLARSFAGRITGLKTATERLADSLSAEKVSLTGHDELDDLSRSFNHAALRMRVLVDSLSLESARREAILSSMVEGVLAVDGRLRVTFSNASLVKLVGAREPIPLGSPLFDIVRDPGLTQILSAVLATGESQKEKLQFPGVAGPDGRWFEVQAAPLDGPSGRGALAILHDISDIERLERIRKDFVANVSHELRTPLTAICGYAETLLEGAVDDRQNNRRFLDIIKAHAIRLNNIASDLLALSELESTRAAVESGVIEIREALEVAFRTVESEARVRDVHLHCGRIEDVKVRGAKVRLEQALVNLLDNAVKFNRPGGEVRVECGTANGTARIIVADSGIGIPSDKLPRIFERFYRVDQARSREMGGTGLGLSIVKHVAERMNGSVKVESVLGKGSTFMLLLPLAREADNAVNPPSAA
jgi:two-component system phosphate regulon sensor histidine kinase PhoR